MKKALLILLSTLMLFAFASCDGRYIPTPKNGYVEIKEGATAADINEIINSKPFVEGIWSKNNVVIKMRISDEITINRNFGFLNVTFEAELPDVTFEPGTQYNYSVKLNYTPATAKFTASITDWKTVDMTNTTLEAEEISE